MAFGPSLRKLPGTYLDTCGACSPVSSLISLGGIFAQVTYIIPTFIVITGKNGSVRGIQEFSRERVSNRLQSGANRRDLFYHLVSANIQLTCFIQQNHLQSGEDVPESEPLSAEELQMDGLLAIIAGSDTVNGALSCALYYLVCNPAIYERLQEEVDAAFPSGEEPLDVMKLTSMEWLNAYM